MNIIGEQRERIIKENNTAQEQVKRILENFNKASTNLEINEPLHGDLDFGILPEYGITNLQKITLGKGEITNITGIPETVVEFVCPDNLLINVDALPTSLKRIEISHNFVDLLDLSKFTQLETCILNDNKLTSLLNLPPTLKVLNCANNSLPKLDFRGVIKIETLIVSNNPITIIENLVGGKTAIVDFQRENTPGIEFRNSEVPAVLEENRGQIKNKDVEEALHEYFRMKTNYEVKLNQMKKKVFDKADTKKQARRDILKIQAPCVKCKRNVGTVFSKKNGRYSAVCGDTKSPCKLDIQIYTGSTVASLAYMLNVYMEDNLEIKDAIIRQKLDTLFNYTSEEESVKKFKTELEAYTANSKLFKELFDKQNEIYHSEDKQKLLDKKVEEIFRLNERIAELLKQFEKTQNKEFLQTVVTMQVRELLPETRNLRMLKYGVMEMNKKEEEYTLFQYPVELSKIDYYFGEPARVIKFNK